MKQYRIIEKEAQKWLKPINVPYPNDDEHEEYEEMGLEHPFALQDAVLYKRLCDPVPYIGSREVGTEISETDVKEVHQYKLHHQWHTCSDWAVEGLAAEHQIRVAFIDNKSEIDNPLNICKCVNIRPASYDRQIWLHAPAHMPKDNGYCIDLCIAQEIMQLWMKGITTTGCCCGHNAVTGYIGVEESDDQLMVQLGYRRYNHPYQEKGYFIPKYDRML